jgi:hypothetical protein
MAGVAAGVLAVCGAKGVSVAEGGLIFFLKKLNMGEGF